MSYELKRINFFDMNSDEEVDDDYWYVTKYFDMITTDDEVIEIMCKEQWYGDDSKGEDIYRKENGEWKEVKNEDEHHQFIVDVYYYLEEEFEFYMSDGNGESIGEEEIEEMMNSI